jgi:hypothetical protein
MRKVCAYDMVETNLEPKCQADRRLRQGTVHRRRAAERYGKKVARDTVMRMCDEIVMMLGGCMQLNAEHCDQEPPQPASEGRRGHCGPHRVS